MNGENMEKSQISVGLSCNTTGRRIVDVNENIFIGVDGKVYRLDKKFGMQDVSLDYRVFFEALITQSTGNV